jgi:hypothetical protein
MRGAECQDPPTSALCTWHPTPELSHRYDSTCRAVPEELG